MKLLTVTAEGQGGRSTDFFYASEGEIVTFVSECDGEPVDGACGCRRCLQGLDSGRMSTTFAVREVAITPEQLRDKIRERLAAGGWLTLGTAVENDAWVEEDAAELERLGAAFAPSVECPIVVEKRGNKFQTRPAKYLPASSR